MDGGGEGEGDRRQQLLPPWHSGEERVPSPAHSSSAPAHSSLSQPPPRHPPRPRPRPALSGSRDEDDGLSNIGLHWMRVNGAFQQFRTILSNAAKGKSPPGGSLSSPVTRRPNDAADPAIALISLESGAYPNYTEEGPPPTSRPPSLHHNASSLQHSTSIAPSNTKTIVSSRLVRRKELYEKRKLASDYALFFALLGIILMIVENELSAAGSYTKASVYSYVLKTLVLCSTLILIALIGCFHVLEVQLFMNDNSAEDWRIAMTWRRIAQIATVPVDVLLSIPMFARLYLIGRVMLLHSRLFTDASSRSIGALNRVHFNARFVLKTLMTLCPGTVLLVFTASLWVIAGWILRLCERYHTGDPPNVQALKHQNYLNSLWMIAITFLSVGYGSLLPLIQLLPVFRPLTTETYLSTLAVKVERGVVAVITGIMGAGTASMVVAVIAKKLIYKHRRLVDKLNPSRIRLHQRKFLMAIYELRKVKRDQRKLAENSMTVADIVKTASSTLEMVSEVHGWQEGMETRLTSMEESINSMRGDMAGISTALNTLLANLPSSTNPPSLRHRPQPRTSPHPHSPD